MDIVIAIELPQKIDKHLSTVHQTNQGSIFDPINVNFMQSR